MGRIWLLSGSAGRRSTWSRILGWLARREVHHAVLVGPAQAGRAVAAVTSPLFRELSLSVNEVRGAVRGGAMRRNECLKSTHIVAAALAQG
jgi:hypothetical protein